MVIFNSYVKLPEGMFLPFFAKWTFTWDEDDEGMKG